MTADPVLRRSSSDVNFHDLFSVGDAAVENRYTEFAAEKPPARKEITKNSSVNVEYDEMEYYASEEQLRSPAESDHRFDEQSDERSRYELSSYETFDDHANIKRSDGPLNSHHGNASLGMELKTIPGRFKPLRYREHNFYSKGTDDKMEIPFANDETDIKVNISSTVDFTGFKMLNKQSKTPIDAHLRLIKNLLLKNPRIKGDKNTNAGMEHSSTKLSRTNTDMSDYFNEQQLEKIKMVEQIKTGEYPSKISSTESVEESSPKLYFRKLSDRHVSNSSQSMNKQVTQPMRSSDKGMNKQVTQPMRSSDKMMNTRVMQPIHSSDKAMSPETFSQKLDGWKPFQPNNQVNLKAQFTINNSDQQQNDQIAADQPQDEIKNKTLVKYLQNRIASIMHRFNESSNTGSSRHEPRRKTPKRKLPFPIFKNFVRTSTEKPSTESSNSTDLNSLQQIAISPNENTKSVSIENSNYTEISTKKTQKYSSDKESTENPSYIPLTYTSRSHQFIKTAEVDEPSSTTESSSLIFISTSTSSTVATHSTNTEILKISNFETKQTKTIPKLSLSKPTNISSNKNIKTSSSVENNNYTVISTRIPQQHSIREPIEIPSYIPLRSAHSPRSLIQIDVPTRSSISALKLINNEGDVPTRSSISALKLINNEGPIREPFKPIKTESPSPSQFLKPIKFEGTSKPESLKPMKIEASSTRESLNPMKIEGSSTTESFKLMKMFSNPIFDTYFPSTDILQISNSQSKQPKIIPKISFARPTSYSGPKPKQTQVLEMPNKITHKRSTQVAASSLIEHKSPQINHVSSRIEQKIPQLNHRSFPLSNVPAIHLFYDSRKNMFYSEYPPISQESSESQIKSSENIAIRQPFIHSEELETSQSVQYSSIPQNHDQLNKFAKPMYDQYTNIHPVSLHATNEGPIIQPEYISFQAPNNGEMVPATYGEENSPLMPIHSASPYVGMKPSGIHQQQMIAQSQLPTGLPYTIISNIPQGNKSPKGTHTKMYAVVPVNHPSFRHPIPVNFLDQNHTTLNLPYYDPENPPSMYAVVPVNHPSLRYPIPANFMHQNHSAVKVSYSTEQTTNQLTRHQRSPSLSLLPPGERDNRITTLSPQHLSGGHSLPYITNPFPNTVSVARNVQNNYITPANPHDIKENIFTHGLPIPEHAVNYPIINNIPVSHFQGSNYSPAHNFLPVIPQYAAVIPSHAVTQTDQRAAVTPSSTVMQTEQRAVQNPVYSNLFLVGNTPHLHSGIFPQPMVPGIIPQHILPGIIPQYLLPGSMPQNELPGSIPQTLFPGGIPPRYGSINYQPPSNVVPICRDSHSHHDKVQPINDPAAVPDDGSQYLVPEDGSQYLVPDDGSQYLVPPGPLIPPPVVTKSIHMQNLPPDNANMNGAEIYELNEEELLVQIPRTPIKYIKPLKRNEIQVKPQATLQSQIQMVDADILQLQEINGLEIKKFLNRDVVFLKSPKSKESEKGVNLKRPRSKELEKKIKRNVQKQLLSGHRHITQHPKIISSQATSYKADNQNNPKLSIKAAAPLLKFSPEDNITKDVKHFYGNPLRINVKNRSPPSIHKGKPQYIFSSFRDSQGRLREQHFVLNPNSAEERLHRIDAGSRHGSRPAMEHFVLSPNSAEERLHRIDAASRYGSRPAMEHFVLSPNSAEERLHRIDAGSRHGSRPAREHQMANDYHSEVVVGTNYRNDYGPEPPADPHYREVTTHARMGVRNRITRSQK